MGSLPSGPTPSQSQWDLRPQVSVTVPVRYLGFLSFLFFRGNSGLSYLGVLRASYSHYGQIYSVLGIDIFNSLVGICVRSVYGNRHSHPQVPRLSQSLLDLH